MFADRVSVLVRCHFLGLGFQSPVKTPVSCLVDESGVCRREGPGRVQSAVPWGEAGSHGRGSAAGSPLRQPWDHTGKGGGRELSAGQVTAPRGSDRDKRDAAARMRTRVPERGAGRHTGVLVCVQARLAHARLVLLATIQREGARGAQVLVPKTVRSAVEEPSA